MSNQLTPTEKLNALRKTISGFNGLASNESNRNGFIAYLAKTADVTKEEAKAYVSDLISRMDDGRDEETDLTTEDSDILSDLSEEDNDELSDPWKEIEEAGA